MIQKKRGLYVQISLLIVIGIFTAGIVTFISEHIVSEDAIMRTTGSRAEAAALETISAIKEYPAYK